MQHFPRALSLLALLVFAHFSQAGPPLAIDDPGIVPAGKFEMILSTAMESRDGGDSFDLPAFEVTYGVIEDKVQATAAVQRLVVDPDPGSSKSDWGEGALNVKYRFVDEGPLQVAVSPAYVFNLRDGAVDRGIADDLNEWFIPIDAEYDFGTWTLGAEVSYTIVRGDRDAWGYGVAAYYALPKNEDLTLMAEFYGDTDEDFDNGNSAIHVGMSYAMGNGLTVLASVGTGLVDADGSDKLDFDAFLGLQYETP